jgi:hypothetical protein
MTPQYCWASENMHKPPKNACAFDQFGSRWEKNSVLRSKPCYSLDLECTWTFGWDDPGIFICTCMNWRRHVTLYDTCTTWIISITHKKKSKQSQGPSPRQRETDKSLLQPLRRKTHDHAAGKSRVPLSGAFTGVDLRLCGLPLCKILAFVCHVHEQRGVYAVAGRMGVVVGRCGEVDGLIGCARGGSIRRRAPRERRVVAAVDVVHGACGCAVVPHKVPHSRRGVPRCVAFTREGPRSGVLGTRGGRQEWRRIQSKERGSRVASAGGRRPRRRHEGG